MKLNNFYFDQDSFNPLLLRSELEEHGTLLIKGLQIDNVADLLAIKRKFQLKDFSYKSGNSPRTMLFEEIYTASNYSPSLKIHLHNELSYAIDWPKYVLFYCERTADSGGESLLASNLSFTKHLDKKVLALFRERGLLYVQTMNADGLLGPSWKEVFQTQSIEAAKAFCEMNQIVVKELGPNTLQAIYKRPAVQNFSYADESIWFCQPDQWHAAGLPREVVEMARRLSPTNSLPHEVFWGDGSQIEDSIILEIQSTFAGITEEILLQKGDLLMIDNTRHAHGRNPYSGQRKILASLAAV